MVALEAALARLIPLIPLSEAGRLLGIAPQTMRNRLRRGALHALEPRMVFGRWKVLLRAVEARRGKSP